MGRWSDSGDRYISDEEELKECLRDFEHIASSGVEPNLQVLASVLVKLTEILIGKED